MFNAFTQDSVLSYPSVDNPGRVRRMIGFENSPIRREDLRYTFAACLVQRDMVVRTTKAAVPVSVHSAVPFQSTSVHRCVLMVAVSLDLCFKVRV